MSDSHDGWWADRFAHAAQPPTGEWYLRDLDPGPKTFTEAGAADLSRSGWTQRVTHSDYYDHIAKENTVPTPSKLFAQILPWIVRTLVPLAVAWIVSWLPSWLGLTDDQLAIGVTLAVTYGAALVVRLLEVYVDPKFGVLLGWAKPAVYPVKETPVTGDHDPVV